MTEFWSGCGYGVLERADGGRLRVTDDYLRWICRRPELAPIEASCAAERALHASLLTQPRRAVSERELESLADADARDNYRVMLRYRAQLLAASDLQAFYAGLFQRDVAVPPDFIDLTVQAILRGLLDGVEDGLVLRAAELFFRPQRVTIHEGMVMLADAQTVNRHASGSLYGGIGQLLKEAQTALRSMDLDVLSRENAAEYFGRDERFDTALAVNPGQPGSLALCEVMQRWIAHFHGVAAHIVPVREIPDEDWRWHLGLDAEASAILNDVYTGVDVDETRMQRILGLFRAEFPDGGALRAEMAGRPVFLGMAMTPEGVLRLKPQNLLVNLPLVRRA